MTSIRSLDRLTFALTGPRSAIELRDRALSCCLRAWCVATSSCRCISVRASGTTRAVVPAPDRRPCWPSAALALLLLPLFHPLGEAGFRVDESFSGVTHAQSVSARGGRTFQRSERAKDPCRSDRTVTTSTEDPRPPNDYTVAAYNSFRGTCSAPRSVSPGGARVVQRRLPRADQAAAARAGRRSPAASPR